LNGINRSGNRHLIGVFPQMSNRRAETLQMAKSQQAQIKIMLSAMKS